jgi:hypothetical protein
MNGVDRRGRSYIIGPEGYGIEKRAEIMPAAVGFAE